MFLSLLFSLISAETYYPTSTKSWDPVSPEPEWPTDSPVWINPYTPTQPKTPDSQSSGDGLSTGEIAAIATCSSIAFIAVAVVAGYFIRRKFKYNIAESALNPDPLVY